GLERPAPVVVFFYGGSWEKGSKDRYLFVGQAFASAGAVVVIPDYRTWPEVMFPAFLEDGAKAVAWVQENIGRFGGDQEQVTLMGHSAGAHIAAMVALDRSFLTAAGGEPAGLDALVGIAGPYDFLPIRDPTVKKIFDVDDEQRTQPINFVRPGAPRTLLLHGGDDTTVVAKNSRNLAKALVDAGVPVDLHIYDEIGHLEIVAALAAPLRWIADTREDAVRFLDLEKADPTS
ncbi:MAG: alpha/beta hydrolase, partial [Geminicoccaceae bacterium]|nr:alpha/beta hydrolase [Geminicoccaceae bacterium]